MRKTITENACIVCLKFNGTSSIFRKDISRKIFEFSGIQITQDMNLPKKICRKCSSDVNAAYDLRLLIRASYKTLIKELKKTRKNLAEETVYEDPISTCEDSNTCDDEMKTTFDVEQVNVVVQNKAIGSTTSSDDANAQKFPEDKKKFTPIEQEIELEIKVEMNETEKPSEKNLPNEGDDTSKISNNDVICSKENLVNKVKDERTRAQPTHIRKKNKTYEPFKIYVCELCGNQYKYKHALRNHMKWHTKDKSHTCKLCSKTFSASSNLKIHMNNHMGERPFMCSYCAKTFAAAQTRANHERTHTGERPFVCEICGKSFTYSFVLVNHMLVHTGERPYECIPCKKRFTKKYHLQAHEETFVHKAQIGLKQNLIEEKTEVTLTQENTTTNNLTVL